MPQVAQVKVLFVNPPSGGKPFGSIKTQELGYVSVKPEILNMFQVNRTYVIQYDVTPKGYKNFVRFGPMEYAPNGNGSSVQGYTPPAPPYQPPPPTTYGQQAPTPRQTAPAYQQQSEKDDPSRMIFVTGVVGRAMGSGQFGVGDIASLATTANETYNALKDNIKATPPASVVDQGFNDRVGDIGTPGYDNYNQDPNRPPF